MTEQKKEAAGGASLSDAVLDAELERELRAAINPLYEDVRGTESYERKRLLCEIDRLRNELKPWQDFGRAVAEAGGVGVQFPLVTNAAANGTVKGRD